MNRLVELDQKKILVNSIMSEAKAKGSCVFIDRTGESHTLYYTPARTYNYTKELYELNYTLLSDFNTYFQLYNHDYF